MDENQLHELREKLAPRRFKITTYLGGGREKVYRGCVIDHELMPELTFTTEDGKKIVTTCAYTIEEN